jgi:hypothetical protein
MQFQGGAGDVLFFRDADEIAEMAQFHAGPSMPFGLVAVQIGAGGSG